MLGETSKRGACANRQRRDKRQKQLPSIDGTIVGSVKVPHTDVSNHSLQILRSAKLPIVVS